MIFELFIGIALAAIAFMVLFWSASSLFATVPRLTKYAHAATTLMVLAAMTILSKSLINLTFPTGLALTCAALTTAYLDRRRQWLIPAIGAVMGLILMSGLPFS
jgi:hypothetical protein